MERCKAPPDTGPCRARLQRWFYDAGKRRCFPFVFGGCRGNANKYHSEDECLRKCAVQGTEQALRLYPKAISEMRSI